MATIAQRNVIVKFQADTKQARRNIKNVQNDVNGLSGNAQAAASSFKSLFAFAAAGAVTAGVAALGKSAAQLAINFEQTQVAFETFLGSAERANQVLAELQEFSTLTPFEPEQVIRAGQSLLAFGVEADKLTDTLRVLGDISAGTGTDFNELAELFGKARVQGRLFAEDINQLTGRGIPIIGEFAKQFGVAEAEVRDLVKEGKIGFAELEQAFVSLTSEGGKFFELTAKQSQTVGGRISTLVGNFNELLKTLGERLLPVISATVDALNGLVSVGRELVEVPLSEEFEQERVALDALAIKLSDTNLDEKDRLAIINELKKQYPGYVGELDAEKVTNEELLPILDNINDALIQRIILQQKEEEVLRLANIQIGSQNDLTKVQDLVISQVQNTIEALGFEVDKTGKSFDEYVISVINAADSALENIEQNKEAVDSFLRLQEQVSNLQRIYRAYATQVENVSANTADYNKANDEFKQLSEDLNDQISLLTKNTIKQTEEVKKGGKATDDSTESDQKKLDSLTKQVLAIDKLLEKQRELAQQTEEDAGRGEQIAAERLATEELLIQNRITLAAEERQRRINEANGNARELEQIEDEFNTTLQNLNIELLEARLVAAQGNAEEILKVREDLARAQAEIQLQLVQAEEDANLASIESDRRAAEEKQRIREEQQEKELEAINQFIAANQAAANAINEIGEALFGEQIRRLDEQIAAQEDALKDSLANIDQAGAEQVQLEENRLEELENQRARAAENLRIVTAIEVAANQAAAVAAGIAAVSKAFAEGPVQGIITSVSLAATIASSVVALRQAFGDIPAFAEGTEFFDGVGGPKSDSNLAYISRGERIVPADRNSQYFDTLNEFQNGTPMADLLHDIAQGKLPIPTVARDRQAGGDRSMLEELTAIKKHLSRLEMNVHLDKDGFSASMTKYQSNKGKFNRKLNA